MGHRKQPSHLADDLQKELFGAIGDRKTTLRRVKSDARISKIDSSPRSEGNEDLSDEQSQGDGDATVDEEHLQPAPVRSWQFDKRRSLSRDDGLTSSLSASSLNFQSRPYDRSASDDSTTTHSIPAISVSLDYETLSLAVPPMPSDSIDTSDHYENEESELDDLTRLYLQVFFYLRNTKHK